MAAVRCAARRLGGALLQRERRQRRDAGSCQGIYLNQNPPRYLPLHLHRGIYLTPATSPPSKRERSSRKEALYDAVANAELKRKEFNDALIKAGDPTGEKHLDVLLSAQRTGYERLKMYGRRAQGVLELTLKLTWNVVLAIAFVRICRDKREDVDSGETTTEVPVAN